MLAYAAQRVVIIEPDGLAHDLDGAPRPGVPQEYQVHTLLPGGRAQFERFLPGIAQEALDNGASCPRLTVRQCTLTTRSSSVHLTQSCSAAAGHFSNP